MVDKTVALTLDQVSFSIGHQRLLNSLNLSFDFGKITAIVGPNGAGKSSLLKLLCGEYQPDQGSIYLENRLLSSFLLCELAKKMAVHPQHHPMIFGLTVRQIVALGRLPYQNKEADNKIKVEQALCAFELIELAERRYESLSGGEQQRTHLARLFAQIGGMSENAPYSLLLDEPTAALDPRHQKKLMALLKSLAGRGCAIIVVLHDLNAVSTFCDAVVLLSKGELVSSGATSDVLSSATLSAVFDVPLSLVELPCSIQGQTHVVV